MGQPWDHKFDAFAADFCALGVWEREGGERPPVLAAVHNRQRLGREIMHLSYHRLDVPAETKDWPVGQITMAILEALRKLADLALPERMDEGTRSALRRLSPLPAAVVTTSSSTASYRGGTIPFPAPGSQDGSG